MSSEDKIEKILKDMIRVLGSIPEHEWEDRINIWQSKWLGAQTNSERKYLARNMIGYFKGAGSINDLVFYRDGEVLFSENTVLDELRSALFDELSKTITRM